MSLNLSTLFYSSDKDTETYLANITLTEAKRDALLNAKTTLRAELRERLKVEIGKILRVSPQNVTPKFVTQGSVAYKTINDPCRPPQQADLDDGLYLPLSYIQEAGQPSEAANTLFDAVAKCASEVAASHGWKVKTNNSRCIRVEVSSTIHIDLPIYSIPDDEFRELIEARAHVDYANKGYTLDQLEDLDWDDVQSHRVLLATRDEGWLAKDPRPIRDWVNQVIGEKGEQLRRIMRYVKAWRDFQEWKLGDDPKSIMLMVAAAEAFDEKILKRDDLALMSVARRMADIVKSPLYAPWDSSEDLTSRLDRFDGLREDVSKRLSALADAVDFAINGAISADHSLKKITSVLGTRVPQRVDLIAIAALTASSPAKSDSPGFVGRQNNA